MGSSRSHLLLGLVAFFLPIAAAADTRIVLVQNFEFNPRVLVVNAGDTVRWTWVDGFHTATSGTGCTPSGLFDGMLDPTHPTFEHTFATDGAFPYFCTPHCHMAMTGTIQVGQTVDVQDPPVDGEDPPVVTSWARVKFIYR